MITKEELKEIATSTINENQELLDRIQSICQSLITNCTSMNIQNFYEYQDILTGIYGTLNPIYKKLRALKENYEAQRFNQLKLEADVNGTKFIAEVAKREASEFVSDLRLARDLLEGYIEACVQAIQTCRTHIWEYKQDTKYEI